jgi:3-phosphoinositide dependent protein kinase-1
MEALRSHRFFASIHWDTLWDDPAPPLETGLVRREAAPVDEWDDVGATWDELVSGPDGSEDEDEEDGSMEELPHPHGNANGHVRLRAPGDDGIEWAPDAQAFVSPPAIPPEEIGPYGEIPDYAPEALALADAVDAAEDAGGSRDVQRAVAAAAADANGSVILESYEMHFALPRIEGVSTKTPIIAAGMGEGPAPGPGNHHKSAEEKRESPATSASGGVSEAPGTSAPLPIPRNVIRDSYATSSSDGSPVEKLGAALEAIGIHRGRLRTRSPTPARGAPGSVEAPDWYAASPFFELVAYRCTSFFRTSVLNVGERMLYHAPVEETALKRRTSRLLLPLPVSQRKLKVRELALTSHRLLCLKPHKSGLSIGIKAEFTLREASSQQHALQPAGREKEKRATKGDDIRGVVTGIERKSAREFVILTVRLFFFSLGRV